MSIIKANTFQDRGGNVLLSSNGSGTISAGGAITNTPAFEATISTDQTLTADATQDVALDTENFDTDSSFNTNTYIFQPTVAGKYFVYGQARFNHGGDDLGLVQIAVKDENDTLIVYSASEDRDINNAESRMLNFSKIVDMNGSTNTLKMTTFAEQLGTGSITLRTIATLFGAYRLIGV